MRASARRALTDDECLKKLIQEGKPVINGWLQIPHSFSAEVMAKQGYDSLTIDMQHGVVDYSNALQSNRKSVILKS